MIDFLFVFKIWFAFGIIGAFYVLLTPKKFEKKYRENTILSQYDERIIYMILVVYMIISGPFSLINPINDFWKFLFKTRK